MSHQFTQKEIDNAKIQVLQFKLGMGKIPFEELYEQAIAILEGAPIDHSYDGDTVAVEQPPETEQLDG